MSHDIVAPGEASPFTDLGTQWAWNSTSLSAYKKCPRYYQYTVLRGLRRKHESVHLRFGSLYAQALEHFFQHMANGATRENALRAVVREAMVETWTYTEVESDGPARQLESVGPWISGHNTKTRETLIRSIIWYIDEKDGDTAELITLADGTPAVELTFKFEVQPDIVLCGHMDKLVQWGDETYVMDQKTTGTTLSSRYFDQWTPSNQMSLYSLAGKVVFGTSVRGVIIDAAQIAVGFTRFERGFAHRTQDQLDEWLKETIFWIRQAQAATIDGYFPMNDRSCHDFGGCAFRDICSKSPSVRQRFLDTDFEVNFYNPLSERASA